MVQPRTQFDWNIYGDATFAGLSALVPLPFLDTLFEAYFRRRMPRVIARNRDRRLSTAVLKEINRSSDSWLRGCLIFAITFIPRLLVKLSRKLLYFLTVKEATDKLSYYWHRAFLLDYLTLSGHLDELQSAAVAKQALEQTLSGLETSPVQQLAGRIVNRSGRILRTLRRARRGTEDESIREDKSIMARNWSSFSTYFESLAEQYDSLYYGIRSAENSVKREA